MTGIDVKRAQPLWRIALSTNPSAEEAVLGLFEETFSVAAVSYTDVETGRVTVTAFLPGTRPATALLARLRAGVKHLNRRGAGPVRGRIVVEAVRQRDWAEAWKRHFKPIEIGRALLLKPGWSRRQSRKGQVIVTLDPGLSFGTGQHPTTRFCLEQLVARRNRSRAQSVLDIGTGSGILAIAAAKLGYGPIDAFDFDSAAVAIAEANARRNRVRDQIRIYSADLASLPERPARRYEVICANLVSDLLIAERRCLLRRLDSSGLLVMAGILKSEFPELRRVYEREDLHLMATLTEGEWQSGAFTRSPPYRSPGPRQ